LEDKELIEAFQAGREPAFTELVERYRRQVYRVARSVLRNHEKADEATQDAFVKAYQGLGKFKGESTFKTWMYRIATNAALDLRAKEITQDKARRQAQLEAKTAVPNAPLGPRPLESLIQDERMAKLRTAMASLPEKQRITMTLRVNQELKYTEIAEVLGCPVGTAKANFHHAVKNLRKALAKLDPSAVAEMPGTAKGKLGAKPVRDEASRPCSGGTHRD
jgi:RNA polymerase sigma-70 factor (ECF subfamily)